MADRRLSRIMYLHMIRNLLLVKPLGPAATDLKPARVETGPSCVPFPSAWGIRRVRILLPK
jgi:hypothetical protein